MSEQRGMLKGVQAMREEAYRACEAISERHFDSEALEGCVRDFARYIVDLTDILVQRDRSIVLLNDVAHRAWHLLDESGEVADSDDIVSCRSDVERLSDALDALEATGWDGCGGFSTKGETQ